jgi:type IV secretory pathway VirB2 component (pilin)
MTTSNLAAPLAATSPSPSSSTEVKVEAASVLCEAQAQQAMRAQPALVALDLSTASLEQASVPVATNNTPTLLTMPEQAQHRRLRLVKNWLRFSWATLAALALTPLSAFAQTPPAAPAAFQTAVTNIVAMIKAISGPAILLLIVAGLALVMWGGINENWKRRGLSIIGCGIVGAGLLFMFADPLAQFIASTVGAGGGAAPPRP